jgi:hypothetical protein
MSELSNRLAEEPANIRNHARIPLDRYRRATLALDSGDDAACLVHAPVIINHDRGAVVG